MFKVILMLMVVAIASTAMAQDPYVAFLNDVEADEIKDGDTPLIEIRMYGIDTPEKHQLCERANGSCYPCGKRATWALQGLLSGQKTTYRFTGDATYGRPVATIFIGSRDVNLDMVKQGHAVVYERYLTDSMKTDYLAAQDDAKANQRGLWQGNFIMPEKWRRGDRLSCE